MIFIFIFFLIFLIISELIFFQIIKRMLLIFIIMICRNVKIITLFSNWMINIFIIIRLYVISFWKIIVKRLVINILPEILLRLLDILNIQFYITIFVWGIFSTFCNKICIIITITFIMLIIFFTVISILLERIISILSLVIISLTFKMSQLIISIYMWRNGIILFLQI